MLERHEIARKPGGRPPPGSQMDERAVQKQEAVSKAARSRAATGSFTATQPLPVLPHLHLLQTYLASLKGESSPVSGHLQVRATATDLDRTRFCFPALPTLPFARRQPRVALEIAGIMVRKWVLEE